MASSDQPPPYDDVDGYNAERLQPMILVLSGQSIHAESAHSAPLYQLDRGVSRLSHATTQVKLERLDRRVISGNGAEPTIKVRAMHIYDLKHLNRAPGGLSPLPSFSPPYYIHSMSRKTIGSYGMKKQRFKDQWQALSLDVSGKNSDYGIAKYLKDTEPLFRLSLKNGRYEWFDRSAVPIAFEDQGESQHRLIISAPLQRTTLDVLVGLWCCRIWQEAAENDTPVTKRPMENGE